jgi:hypothetical protein
MSTEAAEKVIALLGGDAGLTKLKAFQIEALRDGLIFNMFDTDIYVVVLRETGDQYALTVAGMYSRTFSRFAGVPGDRITGLIRDTISSLKAQERYGIDHQKAPLKI